MREAVSILAAMSLTLSMAAVAPSAQADLRPCVAEDDCNSDGGGADGCNNSPQICTVLDLVDRTLKLVRGEVEEIGEILVGLFQGAREVVCNSHVRAGDFTVDPCI